MKQIFSAAVFLFCGTAFAAITTDQCPTLNTTCTPSCPSTGPRHNYTVTCTYQTNGRCVDGTAYPVPYEIKYLPNSIKTYVDGFCSNSTGTSENITKLPYTFSEPSRFSTTTITVVPVTVSIRSHVCVFDYPTNSCTAGD